MEVLKVMLDAVKGKPVENYSKGETSEAIRNALIEANGGSQKIDPKTFYRGSALFSLVQELIPAIIDEGFKADDPIFSLVEYRNIADGDEQEFYVRGNSLFAVADAAAGIRGVRRQRIDDGASVTVKTSVKMVRVYDDLSRFLAGRITFEDLVDNVSRSFNQEVLADAAKAVEALGSDTAGLKADLVVSGTYSEDTLLDLIDDVEGYTGKPATIYGTRKALRKVTTAVVADEAKSDLYNMGYYGKFNGTPMVCLRQVKLPGTATNALSDNRLYVIVGDDKPIKVVNEGSGIMLERDAGLNNDLTQEYIYGQPFGVGAIAAEQFGVYTMS